MKTLNISNATYGLIWSLARETDRTEDDILARVLRGSGPVAAAPAVAQHQRNEAGGFVDDRYGVIFQEGFAIERTYKANAYTARVLDGKWSLSDRSERFDSLNALNRAIGAGTENAWYSWYYRAPNGKRMPLGSLRDPSLVKKRTKNKDD